MEMHYEGFAKSHNKVLDFSREECIDLMGDLFGVPDEIDEMSDEEVKREALEQHDREWTTPEGEQKKKDLKAYTEAILSMERLRRRTHESKIEKSIN